MKEVKANKAAPKNKKSFDLTLYTSRHGTSDLEKIEGVLKQNPGKMPVTLHIRNTLGKRVAVELGTEFNVRRTPKLDQVLARYID